MPRPGGTRQMATTGATRLTGMELLLRAAERGVDGIDLSSGTEPIEAAVHRSPPPRANPKPKPNAAASLPPKKRMKLARRPSVVSLESLSESGANGSSSGVRARCPKTKTKKAASLPALPEECGGPLPRGLKLSKPRFGPFADEEASFPSSVRDVNGTEVGMGYFSASLASPTASHSGEAPPANFATTSNGEGLYPKRHHRDNASMLLETKAALRRNYLRALHHHRRSIAQ